MLPLTDLYCVLDANERLRPPAVIKSKLRWGKSETVKPRAPQEFLRYLKTWSHALASPQADQWNPTCHAFRLSIRTRLGVLPPALHQLNSEDFFAAGEVAFQPAQIASRKARLSPLPAFAWVICSMHGNGCLLLLPSL